MQLTIYATRQSIYSPISDDYIARAENEVTIKQWHNDRAANSNYIPSTFLIFPLLAMIFTFFAVYYYNESQENHRMYKMKRILSSKDCYGKRVVKYELQNEFVVSVMFSLHVIILSILGVVYTLNIDKYLNEYVNDYFSIYNLSTSLEFSASLAIITLSLDLVVVVVLQIFVIVIVLIKKSIQKRIFRTLIQSLCIYGGIVPTASSFLSASSSAI